MSTIEAPKAATLGIVGSPTDLYVATAKTIVEVIVVNIDNSNAAAATISWLDFSSDNFVGRICYQKMVAAGNCFVTARKTLDVNDRLQGYASAPNAIQVSVNVVWKAE